MKKLFTLTICCFVATCAFAQGKLTKEMLEAAKDMTGLMKWTGKVRCPDCPNVYSLKNFAKRQDNSTLKELNRLHDIRWRKFSYSEPSLANGRKSMLAAVAHEQDSRVDKNTPFLSPEDSFSEEERFKMWAAPSRFIQGGDGTLRALSPNSQLDILMAFDAFAKNAPHEFFSEPIYHPDGNVYLQVRIPFTAFDTYGSQKFYRFKMGSYINIINPFNTKDLEVSVSPRERANRFIRQTEGRSGVEMQKHYQEARKLAADSQIVLNNPITVKQLHALLNSEGREIFGPALAVKNVDKFRNISLSSFVPVTSSLLVQQGPDFRPIPSDSYIEFTPTPNIDIHRNIRIIKRGNLETHAYSIDEIPTSILYIEYNAGKFYAYLKKDLSLLLKDKDGLLKVLTEDDILEFTPYNKNYLAEGLLGISDVSALNRLPQEESFPFPDNYVEGEFTLKTLPVSLEKWESYAFPYLYGGTTPETLREIAEGFHTEEGGLRELPDGTAPKQPVATRTATPTTFAAKAYLNSQKVERQLSAQTDPAEKSVSQRSQSNEQESDFEPLPAQDSGLQFYADELTPFGQDESELPGYVVESMRKTGSLKDYEEALLEHNIPLNYVGAVRVFKNRYTPSIEKYLVQVYYPFTLADGTFVKPGDFLNTEGTMSRREDVLSEEQVKNLYREVTK